MKILSQIHVGSLTLLLLLQLSTTLESPSPTPSRTPSPTPSSTNTSLDYIKSSCNATLYKSLCFNSLSPYASLIQSNPHKIAITALNLTLAASESAAAFVKNVSRCSPSALSPREAAAVADCVELMGDSVCSLRDSMREFKNIENITYNGSWSFELVMSDVQTWVSAALTDDDTCMDGFEEKEGGGSGGAAGGSSGGARGAVKDMVRSCVVRVAQMTSNALALINMYASSMHRN